MQKGKFVVKKILTVSKFFSEGNFDSDANFYTVKLICTVE